jgi:hypothetical protein
VSISNLVWLQSGIPSSTPSSQLKVQLLLQLSTGAGLHYTHSACRPPFNLCQPPLLAPQWYNPCSESSQDADRITRRVQSPDTAPHTFNPTPSLINSTAGAAMGNRQLAAVTCIPCDVQSARTSHNFILLLFQFLNFTPYTARTIQLLFCQYTTSCTTILFYNYFILFYFSYLEQKGALPHCMHYKIHKVEASFSVEISNFS